MKLIIDNKNNIICKTSLINNEDIKEEIKKQIEKMIFLDSIYSDNNYVVNSQQTVSENFYIHSNIVDGIKYAVKSSNFTATTTHSNATITKTDLGTPGYYDNIIKINITITYNSNNKFPSNNSETFIKISESGDGVILAIDQ